ncbi:unnamed protein product [Urochloa decumbens]|uniref:Disease resistance protein At4g27190-like leucine-rich repeats domain-containing protein n=1 Tax=Urochloa decumbens TaxID=240449 RepID=A0ABC9BLU6_9POAL
MGWFEGQFEEKMMEWIKEHPVVWNAGIGPAASFVRTLTRLLFKHTKDIYGSYDHIITVRLSPIAAVEGRIACYRRVALDVLMATAKSLNFDDDLKEVNQLAAEENYYGYGMVSDILVLKAFGADYRWYDEQKLLFGEHVPGRELQSEIPRKIEEKLWGKRRLLLVENLHVPIQMEVLFFSTRFRPSVLRPNGWVISTNSKDVCNKSREHEISNNSKWGLEYYHTLPFDDLRGQDWITLIKEALQDAAGSISSTLHQQHDDEFLAPRSSTVHVLWHPILSIAKSVGVKKPQNKEGEPCTVIQRQLPYLDVSFSEAGTIVPMMKLQPRRRHVEISAMNEYPNGLRILPVTNSLFITDDASIRCLNDLNRNLMSLEVCQLENCHEMTAVFGMHSNRTGEMVYDEATEGPSSAYVFMVFPSLKILQASNLNSLVCFFDTSTMRVGNSMTLKLLKRIHLEHCPRLERIFPCRLSLPALETLVILFCPSLKTIFYKKDKYEKVVPSPLPNIESIYLQELPQLKHIHEDAMFRFETPKWETLFVRGCPSFHLPLLKEHPRSKKVKVSGERDWWDKLRLSLSEQGDYYLQMPPPELASREEQVIVKTYLR